MKFETSSRGLRYVLVALALLACSRCRRGPSAALVDSSASPLSDADAEVQESTDGRAAASSEDAGVGGALMSPDGRLACTDLQNLAETVTLVSAATETTSFAGGAIADGTYALVQVTMHPANGILPTGSTKRRTLRASGQGTHFEAVYHDVSSSGTVDLNSSGDVVVAGTEITLEGTCGGGTATYSFSVGGNTFALFYSTGDNSQLTYSYQKITSQI